jgi:hypothetical protein
MYRRLLLLSLFATMPALVCGQEARLINCRSLEAAGNFVGPDEVVVDDLVCQKVKPGAASASAAKPQPPKPLPGVVISDTEPVNVVEAAKASTKRVAAAVEANAEKAAVTSAPESATPAPAASSEVVAEPEPANGGPETENSGVQTMSVAEAARVNAKRIAEAETVAEKPEAAPSGGAPAASTPVSSTPTRADAVAKPQPVESRKAERAEPPVASPPAPDPAPVQPPPAEVSSSPATHVPTRTEPAPVPAEVTPAPASPSTAEPAPEPVNEIVITSAPSHETTASAPTPVTSAKPAPPTAEPAPEPANEIVIPSAPSREAAAPAPTPATPAVQPTVQPDAAAGKVASPAEVAPAPATQPAAAEAPAVEKASAFYDANAPKTSSNRPAVSLGVVSAPPAAAAVSPADESPANAPANAATEAAPAESSDAQTVWPGRDDANAVRERVIETGTFALPKEAPDLHQPAHSKQIAASVEDGFQEGQRPECTKNITMGGLKGEKLVLGTPGWAANWVERNQKRMLQICFSDTPMPGARNYLIVFYTAAAASNGSTIVNPAAPPPQPQESSLAAGVGTFTTSYGSTWHYFYDRNVGTTVNSNVDADQPQSKPDQVTYATAYTEEGVPVAQHWRGAPKKQIKVNPNDPDVRKESKKERHALEEMEHVSDALLSQMVEEIEKL